MQIKIFGPGCPKCHQTEDLVKQVVAEAGAAAEVVKVSDMLEIAAAGVMSTPGVMVDGKLVSQGKVPTKAEVSAWLTR
ncbi:MAG: thioredoxin family protein [Desulfarculus sp.]|nr:thioredoxin family protein [Desulfarculus sp.]